MKRNRKYSPEVYCDQQGGGIGLIRSAIMFVLQIIGKNSAKKWMGGRHLDTDLKECRITSDEGPKFGSIARSVLSANEGRSKDARDRPNRIAKLRTT
jgi:hypothetical protein